MEPQIRITEGLVAQSRAWSSPNGWAGRTRAFLKQVRQLLALVLLSAGAYLLISRFFLQSVTVVGLSMAPTLADSQHYLLNRWVFHVRSPQRSDVVVIRDPLDNTYVVKRIVAVAGDSVYLKEGSIYLNGHQLSEKYLPAGTRTYPNPPKNEQLFTCGANEFFVLGDNRMNSVDSRTYGTVARQNILGLIVR